MSFFTHIFQGIQLDFKLLFFVLFFLGIVLWKGVSRFNGEGVVFQMGGGFIFRWACTSWGRVSKKIVGWGWPTSLCPPTMGKPLLCPLTMGYIYIYIYIFIYIYIDICRYIDRYIDIQIYKCIMYIIYVIYIYIYVNNK